jgi:hypothetical protein
VSVYFSNNFPLNADTITTLKCRICRSTVLVTNISYHMNYYFVTDKMQDRWEGSVTIKCCALKRHPYYRCVSFIYTKSATLTPIFFQIKRNQVHLSRQLLSKGAGHTAFLTAMNFTCSQVKFSLSHSQNVYVFVISPAPVSKFSFLQYPNQHTGSRTRSLNTSNDIN